MGPLKGILVTYDRRAQGEDEMSLNASTWLGEWMQSEGVVSLRKLDRALNDVAIRKRLWAAADQVPYTTEPLPQLPGNAILAGKAIDLSGELDCCLAWDCRQRDIDKLFGKVWHYFDRIVIVGPSAAVIRRALEGDNEDWALHKVRADAQLLFYLNEVGANDMLLFREKPAPCFEHVDQHARSVGIENIGDLIADQARRLRPDAQIELQKHDDHWDYKLGHRALEHNRWGAVANKKSREKLELSVCKDVATDFAVRLVSDMRASRILGLPLGASASIHGSMLAEIKTGLMASNVAFNLELPVLKGISPRDLLALRRDEHESFEKFRTTLRKAIEERLASTASGDKCDNIGAEIRRDLIDPSLNDISLRLRRAEESLQRKHRINIGLGVLSIACGLLGSLDLASALTVATTVGTAGAEIKAIEERRAVALSELYFLWKATKIEHRS